MTFSKMTLNITTFSIQQSAEPNIALIMAEQWYAVSLAECHYAESRYTECRGAKYSPTDEY